MSALIKLFRLLYPFLLEFGIKEINIKTFIAQNKTLSYLLLVCLLLFTMLVYALEQAHLRMLYRIVLVEEKVVLEQELKSSNDKMEQLQVLCDDPQSLLPGIENTNQSIEESLNELTGNAP